MPTRSSASTTSPSAWCRRPLAAWFGPHNPGREPGPPGEKHTDYTAMDIPEGGTSIPYWMEDPFIGAEYVETLAREGVPNRMETQFYDKNFKGELPKGV